MGRPMSLNGYSWVEGNPVMLTDASGKQPPAPPIPWDEIIREVIESVGTQVLDESVWGEAMRQALQRRGIVATGLLISQGLARLSASGIVVSTLIPVQQPNGLICNSWEYGLGNCHPIWDNPETYQSLVPQQPSPQQSIITNLDCLTLTLPQISVPPYRNPIQVDTQTQLHTTEGSCNPLAFAAWWWTLETVLNSFRPNELWYEYEQRVARANGLHGGYARNVIEGPIHADGIEPSRCHLVDAKHASNPSQPQYRLDGPPWVNSDSDDVTALTEELERYKSAVDNGIPVGLTVRTNAILSVPFFEELLIGVGFVLGVDSFVEYIP